MENSISKKEFDVLVTYMGEELTKYSWFMNHSRDALYLIVFGIDKEGNIRKFHTKLIKYDEVKGKTKTITEVIK